MLINILIAILLLPFVLKLSFIVSLIILLVDKYSPFWITTRVGQAGKEFKIIKFQTLKPPKNVNEISNKVNDQTRLTPLGVFIRDHGIDELLQIFNVFTGDMYLIGPRPFEPSDWQRIYNTNPELKDEIDIWKKAREQIKPGITGWAQIHSRGPHILTLDNEFLADPNVYKILKIVICTLLIFILGKELYFKTFFTPEVANEMNNPLVNVYDNLL